MKKTPSLFYQSLVVALIAAVSALLISVTHDLTAEARRQSTYSEEQKALKELIGTNFDNNPCAEKILISSPDSEERLEFYPARRAKTIKSFAIKSYSDFAPGGRMEIMVGFNIDGSIIGSKILSAPHNIIKPADNKASISSLAVNDAVNRAVGAYKKLNSGGLQ